MFFDKNITSIFLKCFLPALVGYTYSSVKSIYANLKEYGEVGAVDDRRLSDIGENFPSTAGSPPHHTQLHT